MMRIGVASEDIYSYYTLDDGRCRLNRFIKLRFDTNLSVMIRLPERLKTRKLFNLSENSER